MLLSPRTESAPRSISRESVYTPSEYAPGCHHFSGSRIGPGCHDGRALAWNGASGLRRAGCPRHRAPAHRCLASTRAELRPADLAGVHVRADRERAVPSLVRTHELAHAHTPEALGVVLHPPGPRGRGRDPAGHRALGFAVGTEPITALVAAGGAEVVATDLPQPDAAEHGWTETGEHATSGGDARLSRAVSRRRVGNACHVPPGRHARDPG